MPEALRPLGLVKELVESMHLEITYAYDDLVFVEHNAFLLRFTGEAGNVDLLFNKECPQEEAEKLAPEIINRGMVLGLRLAQAGWYSLTQNEEDETMSLVFY